MYFHARNNFIRKSIKINLNGRYLILETKLFNCLTSHDLIKFTLKNIVPSNDRKFTTFTLLNQGQFP